MSDATCAAEALLGLPGFRVLGVQEDPGEVIVEIELVAEIVGCPGCGVVARAHGRVVVDYAIWRASAARRGFVGASGGFGVRSRRARW